MPSEKKHETKTVAETVAETLKTFGASIGEILDDPDVKEKGKEFAASIVDAAAKVAASKVESEKARSKFENVGKAAQSLGDSLEKHFKA